MKLLGFVISIIWIAVWSVVLDKTGKVAQILFDRNTQDMVYPFTIQNIMWVMFFVGAAELYYRYVMSRRDFQALSANYLIEEYGIFYDQKKLAKTMFLVNKHDNRLANLIKALFMRYQASRKSTEEAHQMLNSQLEMMQFKIDVDYNIIRYICWFIPTLGFIGTVVGISQALNYAGTPGSVESEMFLSELTSRLSVAFNTTFVALVMSSILVYIMHLIQGKEEQVIQHCGEYCLNNFINRLITN